MAISSQYPGKCKDCGTAYNKGDQIDTNGNESPNKSGEMKAHWCPHGKNCQGAMQLVDEHAKQAMTVPPKRTTEELCKKYYEAFTDDEDFVTAEWITRGEYRGREMLGLYIGVREACESVGITEPVTIGMILNNVVRRMQ